MKKSVLVLACLIVILVPMFGQASSEKEWPHKPIQVIIPAGPGGIRIPHHVQSLKA